MANWTESTPAWSRNSVRGLWPSKESTHSVGTLPGEPGAAAWYSSTRTSRPVALTLRVTPSGHGGAHLQPGHEGVVQLHQAGPAQPVALAVAVLDGHHAPGVEGGRHVAGARAG